MFMSEYSVKLSWELEGNSFKYKEYCRDHTLDFGNNNIIHASASPDYFGNASYIDPEQSFIASLTSCHMLTFLAIASKKRFTISQYIDTATGLLEENDEHKMVIKQINLSPHVTFSSSHIPSQEQYMSMHEKAHNYCFIANTIKQCVRVKIDAKMLGE